MTSSPLTGWNISPAWVDRYLAIIGVRPDTPSIAALGRLMRAHILTIPFENVTSILRRAATAGSLTPLPDANELLGNWEHGRGGGICFERAPMLCRLLEELGYRVTLILAQISFPGSHQALLVELEGSRYLVEVGSGAPFFAPIPLHKLTEVRKAGLTYRFRPGQSADEWCQDRLIHEEWTPFCRYDLRPADEQDRLSGYQRHHTPGQSWVVDRLRIIHCRQDEVVSLTDNELVRFTAKGKRTEWIEDPAGYSRVASEVFQLPALPIAKALQARSEIAAMRTPVI